MPTAFAPGKRGARRGARRRFSRRLLPAISSRDPASAPSRVGARRGPPPPPSPSRRASANLSGGRRRLTAARPNRPPLPVKCGTRMRDSQTPVGSRHARVLTRPGRRPRWRAGRISLRGRRRTRSESLSRPDSCCVRLGLQVFVAPGRARRRSGGSLASGEPGLRRCAARCSGCLLPALHPGRYRRPGPGLGPADSDIAASLEIALGQPDRRPGE
jgi:hypothetical protein